MATMQVMPMSVKQAKKVNKNPHEQSVLAFMDRVEGFFQEIPTPVKPKFQISRVYNWESYDWCFNKFVIEGFTVRFKRKHKELSLYFSSLGNEARSGKRKGLVYNMDLAVNITHSYTEDIVLTHSNSWFTKTQYNISKKAFINKIKEYLEWLEE